MAIRTTRTGQPTAVKYVHRDHLGSTDVLSDATGAVVQRMSFDAWGKRRDPSTWSDSALFAYAFEGGLGFSVTPQYTGHVGLGHLELVHMQGRVYDPVLGRFLSADPYVQDAASPQAFNRYSYVGNNPLSYTDPSGYFSLKTLGHVALWSLGVPPRLWSKFSGWVRRLAKKQWVGQVIGAVGWVIGAITGQYYIGAMISFVASGLQAAINGASVPEILYAAGQGYSRASYGSSGGLQDTRWGDGGAWGSPGRQRWDPPPKVEKINLDPQIDPMPDLSVLGPSTIGPFREWLLKPLPPSAETELRSTIVLPGTFYVLGVFPRRPDLVRIPFSSLDTGAAPEDFAGFKMTLGSLAPNSGMSVQFTKLIDDGSLGMGQSTLILAGEMSANANGDVSFVGRMTGTPEAYNFDKPGLANAVGRRLPGRQFDVRYSGSRPVRFPPR